MARLLKPQKIGEVTDAKQGITIPIMLNRNTRVFEAEYGPDKFSDPTSKAVEEWARKQINNARTLVFAPVILVIIKDGNSGYAPQRAMMDVSISRFFWAKNPLGQLVSADWGNAEDGKVQTEIFRKPPAEGGLGKWTDEEHRFSLFSRCRQMHWRTGDGEFNPPMTIKASNFGSEQRSYLPYDESLWLGLNALIAVIKETDAKLHTLIADETGITRIAEVGAGLLKALPSGDETK